MLLAARARRSTASLFLRHTRSAHSLLLLSHGLNNHASRLARLAVFRVHEPPGRLRQLSRTRLSTATTTATQTKRSLSSTSSSSSSTGFVTATNLQAVATTAGVLARRVVLIGYGTLALIPTSFALLAAYYEITGQPYQRVRGMLFFSLTGFLSLPFSVVMLAAAPFVLAFDPDKRKFMTDMQSLWGRWTCAPFVTPTIHGQKHLKALADKGQVAVLVSNHQSWLDVYALLHMDVPILFVAKQQIFYIPVVGWIMGLVGHVGVTRGSRKSGKNVLERCTERLLDGVPVFFFAEGTRTKDGHVQPFKIGAFKIAAEAQVPIVPMSISGTGAMMPPGDETWLESDARSLVSERGEYLSGIRIVVHPPMHFDPVVDSNLEAFRDRVRDVVVSGVEVVPIKHGR